MKLLACYNLTEARQDKTTSPVEVWRILRPVEMLRKHTDWKIDESIGIFPEAKKVSDISESELEERFATFAKYDLIWGSYYTNPLIHSMTMIAQQKSKVKFIMDVDDNIYDIDPLNPIHVRVEKKYLEFLKGVVRDTNYVTTTTEALAEELRKQRHYHDPKSVVVIPNLISTTHYKHDDFDNGDKIVIGYMGGASHYGDLHHTGMMDALRQIMHENKNIYFQAVGMPIDAYLPKARQEFIGGERDHEDWYKLFSTLNFDIGLAPLEDTPFTRCKSNIKWQEYSLMGACFVGSKVGPYKDAKGVLVDNNRDAWYNGLKMVVDNAIIRKKFATKAKELVIKDHSIENNYGKIEEALKSIKAL